MARQKADASNGNKEVAGGRQSDPTNADSERSSRSAFSRSGQYTSGAKQGNIDFWSQPTAGS